VKVAGHEHLFHKGPARVFNSEEETFAAVQDGRIQSGDVVVIRYEGPRGGPGMREMLGVTAAIAGTAGVPVSTHLYPEVAAHVMRVTETAHWLEWQDWADPILQKPYLIKDSLLHVPDVPGIGLEWNEDVVAANRVDL